MDRKTRYSEETYTGKPAASAYAISSGSLKQTCAGYRTYSENAPFSVWKLEPRLYIPWVKIVLSGGEYVRATCGSVTYFKVLDRRPYFDDIPSGIAPHDAARCSVSTQGTLGKRNDEKMRLKRVEEPAMYLPISWV